MVNVGKPSRGCLNCRRSRVKCDEVRPKCRRCTRLGMHCGWKDEWSTVVRHQEYWAERQVVKRVLRVQNERDGLGNGDKTLAEARSTASPSPETSQRLEAPRLSQSLQIGPEAYAINHFFTAFSFTSGTAPFLYSVEPLFKDQTNTPPSLHSIVPAVALASIAKQQMRSDLMDRATNHYGSALRKLAAGLHIPSVAKHDATLLTVFLMGLYEKLAFRDTSGTVKRPWQTHFAGRMVVLRLRGRDQLRTKTGRNLFMLLHLEQLLACLQGQGEGDPMEEFSIWAEELYPPTTLRRLALTVHKAYRLVKEVKQALRRQNLLKADTELVPLFLELLDIKEKIQLYEENPYPEDRHGSLESVEHSIRLRAHGIDRAPDLPAGELMYEPISVYVDVSRALLLSVYRAVLIMVIANMLCVIPRLDCQAFAVNKIDALALISLGRKEITAAVEAIADDAPVVLGEQDVHGRVFKRQVPGFAYRAYLFIWPLKVALKAAPADSEARQQLEAQLYKILQKSGLEFDESLVDWARGARPGSADAYADLMQNFDFTT